MGSFQIKEEDVAEFMKIIGNNVKGKRTNDNRDLISL